MGSAAASAVGHEINIRIAHEGNATVGLEDEYVSGVAAEVNCGGDRDVRGPLINA